jgi:hypothetical protein
MTGKFDTTSEMTARLRDRKILYYFFQVSRITKINRELNRCLSVTLLSYQTQNDKWLTYGHKYVNT